jgi:dipeptidyl aminopeptidase/acylaminoacyl peptidase
VAQYAVADDGTLAVLGGGVRPPPPLGVASITPGGKVEPWSGGPSGVMGPRFSPDGKRLAVFGQEGSLLIDTTSRLATNLRGNLLFPVWKADGTGVIAADLSANQALSDISLDGTVSRARIATSKYLLWPSSVSRDGKWLAYVETNPGTGNDIWVASVTGEAPPVIVANTPASETHPAFSPDGKWIVYVMAEGGTPALYVRAFPGSGRAEKISADGIAPIWADNGSLYFGRLPKHQTGDTELIRAAIEVDGDRVRLGREQVIATGPITWGSPVGGFDVSRDGRIAVTIVVSPPAPATPPPPPALTVIFKAIR